MITFLKYMCKLRLRKVKEPVHHYTATACQIQAFNQRPLASKAPILSTLPCFLLETLRSQATKGNESWKKNRPWVPTSLSQAGSGVPERSNIKVVESG